MVMVILCFSICNYNHVQSSVDGEDKVTA